MWALSVVTLGRDMIIRIIAEAIIPMNKNERERREEGSCGQLRSQFLLIRLLSRLAKPQNPHSQRSIGLGRVLDKRLAFFEMLLNNNPQL